MAASRTRTAVRLVQRDTHHVRAGQVQVYLPGDIHDTRCLSDTACCSVSPSATCASRTARSIASPAMWIATASGRGRRNDRCPRASPAQASAGPGAGWRSARSSRHEPGGSGCWHGQCRPADPGQALRATPGVTVIVVTAYQTALVMALLPCAALGERFGYRRFSGGVGLSPALRPLRAVATLPWLVAARFIQGLGGAAVMALGVALLRFSVPQRAAGRRRRLECADGRPASAAARRSAPWSWRGFGWPWLFLINLRWARRPSGASGSPRTSRRNQIASMRQHGAERRRLRAAYPRRRAVCQTPASAARCCSGRPACPRRAGAPGAPKAAPLIPLDLLRDRSFRISVIASVCCFTGQTAGLVALPFHLQHGLGQARAAGLFLTAWPLGVAVTAHLAGRLADRIDSLVCATGGDSLRSGLAAHRAVAAGGRPLVLIGFPLALRSGVRPISDPQQPQHLPVRSCGAKRRRGRHAGHGASDGPDGWGEADHPVVRPRLIDGRIAGGAGDCGRLGAGRRPGESPPLASS